MRMPHRPRLARVVIGVPGDDDTGPEHSHLRSQVGDLHRTHADFAACIRLSSMSSDKSSTFSPKLFISS